MDQEARRKNYELAEKLFSEQNFSAAGVGAVIGLSMGFLGRGVSAKFGVIAALYTIVGCILGNLFVTIMNVAKGTSSP